MLPALAAKLADERVCQMVPPPPSPDCLTGSAPDGRTAVQMDAPSIAGGETAIP